MLFRSVQELVEIVQAQDLMIVFLSETWSSMEHMRWVKNQIYFDGCFTVSNDDRGGGLALLWKAGVDVWVDSFLSITLILLCMVVQRMHGG